MIFSRARFTPSSAYSLSSIIARSRDRYEANYSMDGDAPVVSNPCRRRQEDSDLLLPISPTRACPPQEFGKLALQAGLAQYGYIPEASLKEYGTRAVASCFEIAEQPELEGYAYLAEDLAQLKGNRYVSKKTGSTGLPGSMSIRDG
jgi:hypothetical protein